MNLQFCLALIYFNAGIYAWSPFYLSMKQNKYLGRSEANFDNYKNETKITQNKTNRTFIDDDEFMQLLRFYRPI